ncbi:hypothetical protein ASF53_05250 [Methylobacterium sp. Leaf123]|nr:hypothetical protein ASF53_05250 [Methylobacterium sp. Leaf123]
MSRNAVTDWKQAGYLVMTADGKVDVEASEWGLDQRPANYRGGTTHRPARATPKANGPAGKPARPVTVPRPAPPPPIEEWSDEVVEITALAELVGNAGAIAAKVAIEAGATMQVAAILDSAVCIHLWALADRLIGLPDGPGVSPFEAMVDRRIVHPDWAALADEAGEVVDHDAWDAAIDALPSLQPKTSEKPAPC